MKNKVGKDSRSQLVKAKMLEQLLVNIRLKTQTQGFRNSNQILRIIHLNNAWEFSRNFDNNQPLLSIKNQTYTYFKTF